MNAPHQPAPPPDRLRPAWHLWSNPIFRRYVRARLRPQGLGIALIITMLVAGFLFLGIRTLAMYRGHFDLADAERTPLIPLLVLQALILFFLGTGQVAGGMTGEADEGVLDYQRLTPMSPLAKVLGYLFGLPVREYVMFLSTMPFVAWCLWRGQVPAQSWAPLYTVFFTATLGYHLTGLVAGSVLKNRRWAFLFSIFVVFLLYTVMPQVAKFGLTTFKYLTVWPVFEENLSNLLPREMGGNFKILQGLMPEARFFNLKFSEAVFSVFSQGVLILTFVVMLWRGWRRTEAHLLGKAWAVGLFACIHIMLLGNALPLIKPGLLFPSREIGRRFLPRAGWSPSLGEAVAMIGFYGLVTLLFMVILTGIVTPTLDGQARGLRRMRKLGASKVPWFSDAATSFWFVLAMAVIGTAAWAVFANQLVGSRWFAGQPIPPYTVGTFGLVLVGAGLANQALLEARGARAVFLAVIFVGVVPLMTGAILTAADDRLLTAAIWLMGLSPISAPFFAAQSLFPAPDVSLAASRAISPAFWFWQTVTAAGMAWLVAHLRGRKKAQAAASLPPGA